MYAKIRFNRNIDLKKDFISPGGYEMIMGNKSIQFDFQSYWGNVDREDEACLHVKHRYLDVSSFPEVVHVTTNMITNISEINEFYVFTGEPEESDLKVKSIDIVTIWYYDEFGEFKSVSISPEVLSKYNAKLYV